MARGVRLLTAVLCCALVVPSAHANGRFPRAQRLVQDARNPEHLALYGTYGLMVTTDSGSSWSHVCEAATGPFGGEAPLLELMPGGRVIVSSETGLRGSTTSACDWQGLLEPTLPNAVTDITRSVDDDSELWALVSEPDLALGHLSALSRSSDAGMTWSETTRIPRDV